MFPVGWAGFGLLILRLCAAGTLLRNLLLKPAVALPLWSDAGVIIIAILLCIGAFTPPTCIASGLAQIVMLFCGIDQDLFELALSLGGTTALLLLGPGAFSVDGRLFGRRLILPSNSQ